MQCFICGKELEMGYLCKEHSRELKKMLDTREGIIENPNEKYHCLICGEYKERIIVDYPAIGYFCDRDINEEFNNSR